MASNGDDIDAHAHSTSEDTPDLTDASGDGDGGESVEEFNNRFGGGQDGGNSQSTSETDTDTDDDEHSPDTEFGREVREGLDFPDPGDVEHEPVSVNLDYRVDKSVTTKLTTTLSDIDAGNTRTLAQTAFAPDDGDDVTVVVQIIDVGTSPTRSGEDAVQLTVADRTAATRVIVRDDDALDDIELGDEVAIYDLDVESDENHRYNAVKWQIDTSIETVKQPRTPVQDDVKITDGISQVADEYRYQDSRAVARDLLVTAILDNKHVLAPYGSDEVWLYVDDPDRDDYGVWIDNGDERLRKRLTDWLPPAAKSGGEKSKIVTEITDRARCEREDMSEGVPDDADLKWMVGVQNGVVDLRTGELHDHDHQWRLRTKLPTEYHPETYDGTLGEGLDWFLDDVCQSDEDREMCIAMAAHSLMRHHNIKSTFPILGPSNSGKTKWHGAVKRMLGYDNVDAIDFDSFAAGEGFETGKIRNSHAVLDDDASGKKINNMNFFKKSTGGEEVSVNQKYEKLADFQPYATVSWLSNDPAVLGERNTGVTSRLYPIVMPTRHTEDPDDEHKDLIPETELHGRIYTDEEIEALLVAAVEKAGEMYETGKPGSTRSEQERWDLYEWWSDSVKRFFSECVTADTGNTVPKPGVYAVYTSWCDANGLEPMGKSRFWQVAGQSAGVYFQREGVWFDSSTRGIRHVRFAPTGLEHAPDPVLDELDQTGASKNSLDTATPIGDVTPYRGQQYVTVEGTVSFGNPYDPGFIVEDDTGARNARYDPHSDDSVMDSMDKYDEFPDLEEGDRVRIEKAKKTVDDGEMHLQCVAGYTTVKVIGTTPGDEDQSQLDDDGDDGSGESGDGDEKNVEDPGPEGGDPKGESSDEGDPSPPDGRMTEVDVQCRACGAWWPVDSDNGHGIEGDVTECGECGEPVDWQWNVDNRSLDAGYIPDDDGEDGDGGGGSEGMNREIDAAIRDAVGGDATPRGDVEAAVAVEVNGSVSTARIESRVDALAETGDVIVEGDEVRSA